ncbi:MAG: hypothetical protein NC913_08675 [Candidatus Omnitrophica bacterium]|nr:hypothetical protein [Candidatus Omnitrophota bacterium]
MGKLRPLGTFLAVVLVSVVFSGCVQSQKKVPEKTPVRQESQIETKKVMITTGTRILPGLCNPGSIITVKIDVVPADQISGVIVTEKVPQNWQLINSEPKVSRVEPDNVYKWLQWAQQVTPFTIVYQVKVPESAKGKFVFEGRVTTFREGDIPIMGNSEITVK